MTFCQVVVYSLCRKKLFEATYERIDDLYIVYYNSKQLKLNTHSENVKIRTRHSKLVFKEIRKNIEIIMEINDHSLPIAHIKEDSEITFEARGSQSYIQRESVNRGSQV
ncbi:hypothetical protein SS50377_25022 [Spironucleus salmonicida]|uniref:Uncharacterized protein n=1 Tax=Spironucleus salmonicida TaxID=348837 RepID=V6LEW7_9EUKA|nr:hypothetical protein SS50377_25022 [Spironucleus salmonicida]|eukprot:EST43075.1 Hypothetical protein SS50377_17233 [Spironucleus salmonicida]